MHTRLGAGIASLALVAGCAQVLGLQGWTDPPGSGGSSSGNGTGSGGTAGHGTGGHGTGGLGTGSGGAASMSSMASTGLGGGFVDGGTPTCFDGVKDGTESDVDCGGDDCQPCGADRRCNDGADCASGTCTAGGSCAAEGGPAPCMAGPSPNCNDCLKNGLETDVDCGGDACLPCGADKRCNDDADCMSGHCASGACATGSTGKPCRKPADCSSGQCGAGACFTGACCH